jgi:FKBP-type peptidyl-prolyl cis-trans isomerase
MAKRPQRVAALVAAVFFLFASLATSVAVIWTMINQSKQGKPKVTDTNSNQASNQPSLVGQKLAGFTPSSDPVTNLQSSDSKTGDGAEAKSGSTVSVLYTGALVKDGTIFDASPTSPVSLSLNQVIKGWQQGVPGMKVGGTRRLVIPATLAYGAQPPSAAIPPNSDLVFDITLISVQ